MPRHDPEPAARSRSDWPSDEHSFRVGNFISTSWLRTREFVLHDVKNLFSTYGSAQSELGGRWNIRAVLPGA